MNPSASGVDGINSRDPLTKTSYTALSGKTISEANAVNGVFIMVEHFADGSKRTRKLVR